MYSNSLLLRFCAFSLGFLALFLCANAFSFPLNLPDPCVERSGNLFYTDKYSSMAAAVEGKGNSSFFIISKDEVKEMGLFMLNGGEDNVWIVRCGGETMRVNLAANEKKVVLVKLKKAFSNVNYFYEISIKPERDGRLHIKFISDRYTIAAVCLENQQYGLAQMILEELLEENPELIEARLFLGVVYERSGSSPKAVKVFREAMSSYTSLFRMYRALGRTSATGDDEENFEDLFYTAAGMNVNEVTEKYHLRLMPWQLHIGRGVYVEGGVLFRAEEDEPGELLFGPYARFPAGAYTVEYTLSSPGQVCEDGVVRIDVVDYPKKIAEMYINGDEITSTPEKFSISFFNEDPWAKLEFRVTPNGKADILAGEINVFCDVRQSLRRNNLIITESMQKLGIYSE